MNNLKKQQNDAKLKAKEIKQAIDGTNTSNASPEESNHPSPVIMSGKKDEYQDRPTLTLGYVMIVLTVVLLQKVNFYYKL